MRSLVTLEGPFGHWAAPTESSRAIPELMHRAAAVDLPWTSSFADGPSGAEPCGQVTELVAYQVSRRPHSPAVSDRLRQLSYRQLMRTAHGLTGQLVADGVEPGEVLGLMLEPSCDLATALFGTWRAGAIALPLDPGLPINRLRFLIADAGCRVVVSNTRHAEVLLQLPVRPVYVDLRAQGLRRPAQALTATPSQRLACLLYTSGSTGLPKGVALSHAALANKLVTTGAWGIPDSTLSCAWHSSPSFDASLAQLLLPLAHGGRAHALDSQERLEPHRLWATLQRRRVNLLDCTPSWLMTVLDAAPRGMSLRRIVLGGEVLTPATARRVHARFPQATLVNAYGPTEACIDATAHEVTAADLQGAAVPIGRELPGYRIVLLDDAGAPSTKGERGEIAIGGAGLADGYWRQPELTNRRFVEDPTCAGERLYRSGDLGSRRLDGCLEFLGRLDQQAKIRGQRIEVGEVEAALTRQPGVESAVVRVCFEGPLNRAILAAYLVLRDSRLVTVQNGLRRELPAAMVPSRWTVLAALPLLPSGKVDRAKLSDPAELLPAQPSPEDELQAELLHMWRAILGRECTVEDNFFEVGGDSLAAVELIEALAQRKGVALSLATLLAHPTVADLELALSCGLAQRSMDRVLHLSRTSAHAPSVPLFLLPAASGVGFVYAGLARRLAPLWACHALQLVNLGGPTGSHTMDEVVERLADDVQDAQPRGCIQLAGYSAGGAIAHALTAELHRRGCRVSRLWLIDPYHGGTSHDGADREKRAALLRDYLGDMLWDAYGLRGPDAQELTVACDRLIALGLARVDAEHTVSEPRERRALASIRCRLPPGTSLSIFLMLLEGVLNTGNAYVDYEPRPLADFRGDAWLLQPEGDDEELRRAGANCWQRLLGVPLSCCPIPGEHANLLQSAASVNAIARLIRDSASVPRSDD